MYKNFNLFIDGEKWYDIPEFEGLYQFSNLGRYKSLERLVDGRNGRFYTTKEHILKQEKNWEGYLRVTLCKDGVHYRVASHRKIAEVCIPIPEHLKDTPIEQLQVNHINQNKTDNRIENLNWMTAKENTNWGDGIQRRAEKQRSKKLPLNVVKAMIERFSKPVAQIDKNTLEVIATFPSAVSGCIAVGGKSKGKICDCCNGKSKSAYGYKWEYIDKEKG